MRQLITTALVGTALITAPSTSTQASTWGELVELANQMAAMYGNDVAVGNSSNRIIRIKLKDDTNQVVAKTGPIRPGKISGGNFITSQTDIGLQILVLNERTGKWVAKTGWIYYPNYIYEDSFFDVWKDAAGNWGMTHYRMPR